MPTFAAALWGWLLAILVAFVTMALLAAVAVASYTPCPPDLPPRAKRSRRADRTRQLAGPARQLHRRRPVPLALYSQ